MYLWAVVVGFRVRWGCLPLFLVFTRVFCFSFAYPFGCLISSFHMLSWGIWLCWHFFPIWIIPAVGAGHCTWYCKQVCSSALKSVLATWCGCIVLVYIVLVSCLDTSLPHLYFPLTCSWFSFRLVADIAFLRAQMLCLYLKTFQFLYSFCVLLKENLTHLHVNIAIQFNAHIIND